MRRECLPEVLYATFTRRANGTFGHVVPEPGRLRGWRCRRAEAGSLPPVLLPDHAC
ncbi:hypothetical protein [Marilutibacter spongiae]|uniref:Uncharacterized protein n=1 Tax=Marilutibacter spongiae TaxID=2025720 RepID=A0A7W3TL29_9GAMM|nr:hypothetical protein [Lysobacter spongiae]MBB1060322.1 hypothetical protein [Lysobacter spongiae]